MTRAVPLFLAALLAGAQAPAPTPSPGPGTPAPAPAPAPAAAVPALIPLPKDDASTILGRQVLDGQGQAAGRITDVLVDATGVVRAAVVDFGGFLGVGQRRVAIAWSALRFDPATRTIGLTMSAPELTAAPEYKPDSTGNMVATPARDVPRPSALPPPPSANSGAGGTTAPGPAAPAR